MSNETFDPIKANKAQMEFCKLRDVPHFAPTSRCWSCGRNIYAKISVERAGRELITGCPYCHRTFCD